MGVCGAGLEEGGEGEEGGGKARAVGVRSLVPFFRVAVRQGGGVDAVEFEGGTEEAGQGGRVDAVEVEVQAERGGGAGAGAELVAEGVELVADVEVQVAVEVFGRDAVLGAGAEDGFDGPAVDGVGGVFR